MASEVEGFPAGMAFQERLRQVELSAAEERLAQFLLSSSEFDLAILTSSDMVGRTGTSRSTIDRLSRRLGYLGLKEMRRALVQEFRQRSLYTRSEGSLPLPVAPDTVDDIASLVMASLADRASQLAQSLLRNGALKQWVEELKRSKNTQLFGAGESAAACSTLYQRLVRLGVPIQFVGEEHAQVTLAALMNPGDLGIAISYSGRTKTTVLAARTAAARGATVVAVTAAKDSPLGRLASLRIVMPSNTQFFGSDESMSRVLFGGVIEVLFLALARSDANMLANSVRVDEILNDERI